MLKAILFDKLEKIELEILKYWRQNNLGTKWFSVPSKLEKRIVYDGPPTANGLPALHHLLPKSYKDTLQRYFHMKGHAINSFIVFDTHGLPVELAIEKKFHVKRNALQSTDDIADFNLRCLQHVAENVKAFEGVFERFACWSDKTVLTCSEEYIASVWSSFSSLFKNNLVYRDYRVSHYCPSCKTPLSSHEVSQGYKEVRDPSLYFLVYSEKFNASYIVWTTTPWSLLGNKAIALNDKGRYCILSSDGKRYICALDKVEMLFHGVEHKIEKIQSGEAFAGDNYSSVLAKCDDGSTLTDRDVELNKGSGIVHVAPAFGEYDWSLKLKYKLDFVLHLDSSGLCTLEDRELKDKSFYELNEVIIQRLRRAEKLFENGEIEHSYPFCWRCDSRLLQLPVDAWFIRAKEKRDSLLKLNNTVDWRPDSIRDGRFGKWIENNVDWLISRNRYWGTPLPIWQCANKHYKAISSKEELEELSGEKVTELHRPYIDKVIFKCSRCDQEMTRLQQVIDVWYDSAALPFASYGVLDMGDLHRFYPSYFVAEGIDQTRGWFYTLLVLGELLGGYRAYNSVIVIGLLLDKEGRKMSKHLNNIIQPKLLFKRYGADLTRLFLLSNRRHWSNRTISESEIGDIYGRIFVPYINSLLFLQLYMRSYNWNYEDYSQLSKSAVSQEQKNNKRDFFDMWLLSLREITVGKVISACEQLQLTEAIEIIEDFIVSLSTTYIKMNRERFWNEDSRAISILNDTLMKISVLMAPFSPLLTEHCYLNFLKKSTGATLESVHLFEYPRVEQDFLRYELLQSMELMCKTISNVRMLRNKLKIPIKQPLPLLSLTEKLYRDLEKSKLLEVISKEVNVLQISILSDEILESNTEYIFKSNYREIANIFKDKTPIIARYLEKNCDKRLYSAIQSENPTILEIEGESYMIEKNFVLLRRSLIKHKERYFIDSDGDTYYLDTTFDNELILMGALRHLLHRIQSTRKENGLQLSDRIKLSLSCDHEQFKELAKRKLSWIKKELLCKEIEFLSEGELPYGTEGAVVFSYREVQLSFCIVKEA